MKDKDDNIIYVGKAKNLKNRVNSYFKGTHTGKTAILVGNINDFEYIITNNEIESLILEINLIKKYSPKYNILLKDDKTYPYIELTNDKYPKLNIIRTKNKIKNKNKLYGPFPNVSSARKVVDIINRIYPLRKCKTMGKKECLYYHIGECLGYCKHEIDNQKIKKIYDDIISFLSGNNQEIIKEIKFQMKLASDNLNFEKALQLKELLNDIEKTFTKQIIDTSKKYNFDVFGYYEKDGFLSIQVLFIRNGIIYERYHDIFDIVYDINDFINRYIINFYTKFELPKEIVISNNIDVVGLKQYLNINVLKPQKGNIKEILNIANLNAKIVLNEKIQIIKNDQEKKKKCKEELEKLLSVKDIKRIEMFDNSHLFGTYYVSGCVVFDNFIPNKKEYRKYKIEEKNRDDLKAMKEVIYRRYYRMLMEDGILPDLVIVDGGKLQINVAKEIINQLNLKIKVIGLAKDKKHKTNTIIDDELKEIDLKQYSELYVFLSQIQEEVHRFTISYHRNIKIKGELASILDNINGIGDVRRKMLMKKFGSLNKMKEASLDELKEILPLDIAVNFYQCMKEFNTIE